ncbi:MAG TPA: SDR family NAD(P)-dependent oxidoreductase [Stellaceae bacterium]|jgi:NAD(P)-dependent dehydrogenase (short-subunit alcohol dehydrogenase family)|nr:SDR family NAD(P)-dependent oxidoreductase [Stellaceae bacterium]
MTDYHGRTVVVTGGTGALGRAVVEGLLARGAACVVPYIAPAEAAQFPLKDRVTLVGPVDLVSESDVARVYDGVGALWASIHLAGGFAMTAVGDTKKADILKMLEMNLVTCHLCCAAAVRALRRSGQGGRIVNVAARPALEPRLAAGMAAYGASKAAVAALTQALAEEVAGDGILVNAIAPSIIDTPANRAAMPKAKHDAWPKVDEIAATIAFLASPLNRVTRGAIVPVYGKS